MSTLSMPEDCVTPFVMMVTTPSLTRSLIFCASTGGAAASSAVTITAAATRIMKPLLSSCELARSRARLARSAEPSFRPATAIDLPQSRTKDGAQRRSV